jgi:chemotaxis regulatin CheY-phosphate phosphatase CheZ
MSVVDWANIARCANERASERTFNWDEECSPLGDLQTREMALMMEYRDNLYVNILMDIVRELPCEVDEYLVQPIRKIKIDLIYDD